MSEIRIHPLQRARKQLGLKQQVLADLTGLSLPTIKRAERGQPLNDYSIAQICEYFSTRLKRKVEPQELGLYGQWGNNSNNVQIDKEEKVMRDKENTVKMEPNERLPLKQGSLQPLVVERDGCFSFGKIQTTGIVLDGDGTSEYALGSIRTHYRARVERLPEELEARRKQIQNEQEYKKGQGLPYHWNGEIYNLDRFVISRDPSHEHMLLDLWFSSSDYYTFLATNMSLKGQELRKKYLQNVDWYETIPFFSHSFGISLVLITSDGYTLLTQRSVRQGSNAGSYSISANEGLSRELDRATHADIPDLYRCACRGLAEELGLYEPVDFSVSDITFLSFEVDTEYALWGVLGMVKTKRTIAQVVENWQRGVKDKMEHKRVFPVPFTPQEICSFVFSHEDWTPGGLICLYHTLVHEFGREEVNKIISSY